MVAILDTVLSSMRYWMFFSFSFGSLGFWLLYYVKTSLPAKSKLFVRIGFLLFGQMFLVIPTGFVLLAHMKSKAIVEIRSALEAGCDHVNCLNINTSFEKADILNDLKLIRKSNIPQNESSNEIILEIYCTEKMLLLKLKQDALRPNCFWVYQMNYTITSINTIGYVESYAIFNMLR